VEWEKWRINSGGPIGNCNSQKELLSLPVLRLAVTDSSDYVLRFLHSNGRWRQHKPLQRYGFFFWPQTTASVQNLSHKHREVFIQSAFLSDSARYVSLWLRQKRVTRIERKYLLWKHGKYILGWVRAIILLLLLLFIVFMRIIYNYTPKKPRLCRVNIVAVNLWLQFVLHVKLFP
jgi:hypothetical protein